MCAVLKYYDLKNMTKDKSRQRHASANHSGSKISSGNEKAKTCVLVVDDDEKILRFLSSSLRLAGYDIITSTSGEEALQLVESAKPQCIVLDILMPAMDGFEVLGRLRATSKMPVIAISAHASNAGQALSLGANVFLAKPFRPDELIKRIQAILKQ
jgi:DNA-binding response OmpR family regulator